MYFNFVDSKKCYTFVISNLHLHFDINLFYLQINIMVNRIFTFIENQQLTPTEFADKIGVSRASISSIKTGRTQPTLSLVEKIKQHFPDVDVNWLIFGTGDAPTKIESNIKDSSLFDELDEDIEAKDSNHPVVNEYEAVYIAELPNKTEEKTITEQSDLPTPKISTNKSIKKVILLYDDGSFEEFNK